MGEERPSRKLEGRCVVPRIPFAKPRRAENRSECLGYFASIGQVTKRTSVRFRPLRLRSVVQTAGMANKKSKLTPKTVLKLPDREQSKSAVLNSLTSRSSERSYDHAIRKCIDWYCSEPRVAFNKTVVTRYRISLEQANMPPPRSTCTSPPFAGWGTKLPTAVFRALTLQPVSDE
jgi:hypothetical protein